MDFESGSIESKRRMIDNMVFGGKDEKNHCSPKVARQFITYLRHELLTARLVQLFPILISTAETLIYPVTTDGVIHYYLHNHIYFYL